MYDGDEDGSNDGEGERHIRFVTGIASSFHVVVRLTFDDLTANSIVPSYCTDTEKKTISMLHSVTKSPQPKRHYQSKGLAVPRSRKWNIRDSRTRPHHLLLVQVVKRCFSTLADLVKRRVSARSKSS